MLSDSERQEIEKEIGHYHNKRAACIGALKIVQKHHRWVSDEAIQDVAGLLDMPAAELDGVATFFNLIYRRPVGRHVILVCDSVSCWLLGCDYIGHHLSERLGIGYGETTADDKFTLLPMACLGTCDRAPALMVDEDLHQDLTAEKVDALLEHYE